MPQPICVGSAKRSVPNNRDRAIVGHTALSAARVCRPELFRAPGGTQCQGSTCVCRVKTIQAARDETTGL